MHKLISAWHQSASIIKLSFVLHVTVFILFFINPIIWPLLLTIIIANHVVLTAISLWPRSQLLGTNWTKLPKPCVDKNQIALTIDDGPDPDITPKVLAILDLYQIKATFFCIGNKALKWPTICQDIIRRGHAIENHSQQHRHNFSLLGPNGFNNEILSAQNTLTYITGQKPLFFRAPAGLRNPFLNTVLKKLNLTLVSWSARGFDTCNSDVESVKSKLIGSLKSGAILLLHDGNAALTSQGTPIILNVLPDLINVAKKQNLHFVTLKQALNDIHNE